MPTKSGVKQRKKRDTSPEGLLQALIAALERDDAPRQYTAAMEALLSRGPLKCQPTIATEAGLLRAELLAFLRSVVRHGEFDSMSYGRIALLDHVSFRAHVSPEGRVMCAAEGDARDLVVLQLLMLLQQVGLRNVRLCKAPDCRRMFVKTYRREHCTVQCQARFNKQLQRQNAREKRERERERAARRRREAEKGA